MDKWWKTNPNWSSDEDALCRWIAANAPRFFEKNIPFIGYVQIRLESLDPPEKLTMEKLAIAYSWGVGGIHSIPKDETKADKKSECHFELPDRGR